MRRIPAFLSFFLLFTGLVPIAGAQSTIVVPSPSAATIQDGIDTAVSGDTVLVSPGTYFETLVIFGKSITLESTAGRNQTVVDASGTGRVLTLASAPSTTVRGFTFTGGVEASGGGVGVFTTGVAIEACAITGNAATGPAGNGGGLWAQSAGDLSIEDTLVTNNSADGHGGGVLSIFTSLTIRNSDFEDNSAVEDGGGFYIEGGVHQIEGSELRSNSAADGGGLWVIEAELVLSKSMLIDNQAAGEGGGADLSFPLGNGYDVFESTLMGNSAGGSGGGLMGRQLASNLRLRGSMITDNSAGGSGGGAGLLSSGTLEITESTFSNNSAGFFGGALMLSDTNATVENSILWDDTAVMGGNEIALTLTGSAATVRFSDVSPGGYFGSVVVGPGVISLDPAFAAPLAGDYRQTAASPTLDAGSLAPPSGAEDFECDPRLADSDNDGLAVVDMGADECPSFPGDVNNDGALNIADSVHLLAYLFQGGPPPISGLGDINGDGFTNLADAVNLMAYLFQGGAPPVCQD